MNHHGADYEHARGHGRASFDQGAKPDGAAPAANPAAEVRAPTSRARHPLDERKRRQRRGRVAERSSGTINEAAHGSVADSQHRGYLLVTEALDRRAQQRLALKWG
jgi:hypothetical protein